MENHGVLVDWQHHDLGSRVVLTIQSRQKASAPDEVDLLRLMMTKNQAAVLANYLFEIAGQKPPTSAERSRFRRFFG